MHDVHLPQDLVAELAANTARARYFSRIDAPRAALVVVDMQNHWVHPQGRGHVARAQALVPNINRLAAALRGRGGQVAWVRSSFTPDGRSAWRMLFEHLEPAEISGAIRAALSPGHPMHDLWSGLAVEDGDLVVDKDRFSAFARGASVLEDELRRRGVDTVIITGVATNICCESTARDAMMLDFRTVMVGDANAARTDQDHLAGLVTFAQAFGAVMATDEVIGRLRD